MQKNLQTSWTDKLGRRGAANLRRHFSACLLWLSLTCPLTLAQTKPVQTAAAPSVRQKIYALRLKPGQDLRAELEAFTKSNGLRAAYIITCVGSLNHATLRLANQTDSTQFAGKLEIVSLVGTLSPDGPHLHLSVSDSTGKTSGGHLVAGCPVYTTAEIIIGEAQDLLFTREQDEASGYQELKIRPRGKPARRR
jgi:predicted DNA-binding protein with PD1-like motif